MVSDPFSEKSVFNGMKKPSCSQCFDLLLKGMVRETIHRRELFKKSCAPYGTMTMDSYSMISHHVRYKIDQFRWVSESIFQGLQFGPKQNSLGWLVEKWSQFETRTKNQDANVALFWLSLKSGHVNQHNGIATKTRFVMMNFVFLASIYNNLNRLGCFLHC